MKRYLAPLLATGALFANITPTWGQERVPSKVNFVCQEQQGVPTTIAKNIDGQLQPIFHWKSDALYPGADSLKICDGVSKKLNEYFAQGNDPYAFRLIPDEQAGLSAICITKSFRDCDFAVLLIFYISPNPLQKANTTLIAIIDNKFRQSWVGDRGHRSVSSYFALQIELFKENN
jgi:hypothetical protein